jgi:hypothetical protein
MSLVLLSVGDDGCSPRCADNPSGSQRDATHTLASTCIDLANSTGNVEEPSRSSRCDPFVPGGSRRAGKPSDLPSEASAAVERMRESAFLILATSPGNHQAWVAVTGGDADFARRLRGWGPMPARPDPPASPERQF